MLLSESEIRQIFSRWQAQNPEPASELEYVNPFTLLVAVVLSAQATDKSVNLATKELFKVADSPQKMLALGEAGGVLISASVSPREKAVIFCLYR